MKKYLLECRNNYEEETRFNAGSKARNDIIKILEQIDFESIILNISEEKLKKVVQSVKIGKELNRIEENSVVAIQYPFQGRFITKKVLKVLAQKKCKTIAIIHDIDTLRYRDLEEKKYKEIELFNIFDVIICHNRFMGKWIKENGVKSQCINLNLFDYLVDEQKQIKKMSENIVFAGNLSENKSGFIYKLNDINLNLYGANLNKNKLEQNINYLGKFEPEKLPGELKGKYGLIWDGESIESCEGDTGEYLKYNNPHKLSLYMAAGMPVIVWDESAIAEFVKKEKIGFSIGNLNEINEKIEKNECKYDEYIMNCKEIQRKVLNGEYIKESIEKAIQYDEEKVK
ncbi:hypothetical protein [uncultured Clostridium sp.]|uniref:hypothetical protein n=1 Tax=uncultured Clostridium sp. TaxID=59620 RepID=UPI00261F29AC|nr:hypothetical protein [uncultured Clostridium sp.]